VYEQHIVHFGSRNVRENVALSGLDSLAHRLLSVRAVRNDVPAAGAQRIAIGGRS
jgi:hypothetical protein